MLVPSNLFALFGITKPVGVSQNQKLAGILLLVAKLSLECVEQLSPDLLVHVLHLPLELLVLLPVNRAVQRSWRPAVHFGDDTAPEQLEQAAPDLGCLGAAVPVTVKHRELGKDQLGAGAAAEERQDGEKKEWGRGLHLSRGGGDELMMIGWQSLLHLKDYKYSIQHVSEDGK